jgi:CheY-like chemotaxis protein
MSYVLVVDDDAAIRGLVEEALAFEGYRTETAPTTDEALATVDERTPQLIVLDMKMPDDGPRFEAELKKRSLRAPIIATSASTEGPQWAEEIGAHAFLSKPFDIEDLRTAVESAWKANGGRPRN